MAIKSYANHDTNSPGKRKSTKWGLKNSWFYKGKVLYLCGSASGLLRHIKDNEAKGFEIKDQVVVERDHATYQSLIKYKQVHPYLRNLTILCGDMLDIIKHNPHLNITHVDMDTATGLKDSCDQILELINLGIKTIFWTFASRRTDVKDLCTNLTDWSMRHSNGQYKLMPPHQKFLVPDILETFCDGDYVVDEYPYEGLGSATTQRGGSPMVMITLNRNY